jgi:hypothetical protein
MNLYQSWIYPAASLVKANLLFFLGSPFQRPMGSVFYRTIYHFAGFHATWFHIVSLAILTANVPLTYAVARRLGGSRLAALLTYLCVWQKRVPARMLETALISVLYICALSSKEMALMLPALLMAYEAVYNPPRKYTPGAIVKWLFDECRLPLAFSLVAVVFVAGRALGPDTLLANPAYQPAFTWERFMQTSRGFLDALFCLDRRFTPGLVLLVWGVTGAAALVSRSRTLRFAWLFMMLSPLPVAFVPPRGGPQYYLPLFGWSLYAGIVAAKAAQWFLHLIVQRVSIDAAPFWTERTGAACLVTGLVLLPYPYYRALGLTGLSPVTVEAPVVQSIVD